jgi:hypothetical protein
MAGAAVARGAQDRRTTATFNSPAARGLATALLQPGLEPRHRSVLEHGLAQASHVPGRERC